MEPNSLKKFTFNRWLRQEDYLMMKKKFIVFLMLIVGIGISSDLKAQPPGGPGGPGNPTTDPPCWPPPCVPIDGGLSLLLAAGLAYGGKKAYDVSREEK